MGHLEEQRRVIHDTIQASRRSHAQNRALVAFLTEQSKPDGLWGISDVGPEGGNVILTRVNEAASWTISIDGTITPQPVHPETEES